MAADNPTPPLQEYILSKECVAQSNSPLFTVLPAEIRSSIFSLALEDYADPDPDRQYDLQACYSRPTHFSPRRSDTELLRTCRAIYRECWYLPFILKEQTHWVTAQDRAPNQYFVWRERIALQRTLLAVAKQLGDDNFTIDSLHVFSQMYKLEEGGLHDLLMLKHLNPRTITLTIRHADWWYWEDDAPLRFEGHWIKRLCHVLSPATQQFRIELESLERKKPQIDSIAKQMRERWFFKRKDGAVLLAEKSGKYDEIIRWRGYSSWHDETAGREETTDGRLDYYIRVVKFRLEQVLGKRGEDQSEAAMQAAHDDQFDRQSLKLASTEKGEELLVKNGKWFDTDFTDESEEWGDSEPDSEDEGESDVDHGEADEQEEHSEDGLEEV